MSESGASLRAAELIRQLALQAHPEGGWYREIFRSAQTVQPADARPARCAMTAIDFLLVRGQFSAWHRVASDEAWHHLEGGPLRLWLLAPEGDAIETIVLGPASAAATPRHIVPAHCWQAAEPLGDFAYVGATVGPGFDFADFGFGRDDPALREALRRMQPELARLL